MADQKKSKPHAKSMLKQIPAKRYGLISSKELADVVQIFEALPELQYPINSAGELVEKLGGPETHVDVFGLPVGVANLGRAIPAGYFPIASLENFVEKIAKLLRSNRRHVNLSKDLGTLRPHLPKFQFPIQNQEQLLEAFSSVKSLPAISDRLPAEHRHTVDAPLIKEWITRNMKPALFPIVSEAELYSKAMRILPRSSHQRA
jgi:hypothetical protein